MEKRLFGTDGIRRTVGVEPITPQSTLKLGWAIGKTLRSHPKDPRPVFIANDTRASSAMLEAALVSGLLSSGVNTQSLGVLPTPALAYLTQAQNALAGIMITASHNPYTDNGFKLFSEKGIKLNETIQAAISEQLNQPFKLFEDALGVAYQAQNSEKYYLSFCKSTLPSNFSLKGKKIVIDTANGATSQIAPQLFESLEAEVIPICNAPNGVNINLNCGSTQPHRLQQHVRKEKADLGIAFDGDGDRLIMVDHKGTICDGDDLLFILAKHQFQTQALKSPIVGTVMSNYGLEQALAKLGIAFIRTPVGDQHIYHALEKTGGYLGGEPSGHILCKHLAPTADGLITALQVLSALESTSLEKARDALHKNPQYTVSVPTQDAEAILKSSPIQKAITKAEKMLKTNQGRLLIRASGTEPLIRIMTEGTSLSIIQKVAKDLKNTIKHLIDYAD